MVLDTNVHLLETTVSKHLNSGSRVNVNLSIPSKGSVEPAYGGSGPGNATKRVLPSNPTTVMAGKNVRFKDRAKKFKRSKDGAQKGSEKKDRDATDDEAEKKEGKGTPKLTFSRANVLEYCKDFERRLRTQQPKEYIPLLQQFPESVREVLTTWMPTFEQQKWVEVQREWHENEAEERRRKVLRPKKAPEIHTEFEVWTYDNLIEDTPELWGKLGARTCLSSWQTPG